MCIKYRHEDVVTLVAALPLPFISLCGGRDYQLARRTQISLKKVQLKPCYSDEIPLGPSYQGNFLEASCVYLPHVASEAMAKEMSMYKGLSLGLGTR
jgi:hypothetical protein